MLENYDLELKFPQGLVIVPTREIAVQIVNVLNELGRNQKQFKACEFIGGTEVANDRKKIQSAKVVVGTPGRIQHLINNEIFNISNLKTLVLDEADKLLESGQMAKEVSLILKLMHKKMQIIAATATVTDHLEKVMKQVMKNPIGITPKHEIPVLLGIKQFVKILPQETDNILLMKSKIEELHKIFTRITFKQCLLFTDSQSKTESYGNYLNKQGWKNEVINGAQDQAQRLKVLDKLIKFKCRILITTDLMARGIDIENINLIINLDLPYDCFTYLHRIGRAGRFGTHGIAITMVYGDVQLMKFEKILGDIGGNSLKALEYPDESVSYDFWNFEQKNENLLCTISGASNGHDKGEQKITQNGNYSKEKDEILMNNLALLEITKKLVDKEERKSKAFDMSALLDDYEKSKSQDVPEKIVEPPVNLEDENIFLKTIEELQLYDSDSDEEKSEGSLNGAGMSQCENEDKEPSPTKISKEKRKVIFARPAVDEEELSESESEPESSEDEEEQQDELRTKATKSAHVDEPVKQNKPYANNSEQYSSYHNYVASNYSQWENIYNFQLANIQNYVLSARK